MTTITLKEFTILISERKEVLRELKVRAKDRDEAEDIATAKMHSHLHDIPQVEVHDEVYVESVKEVKA